MEDKSQQFDIIKYLQSIWILKEECRTHAKDKKFSADDVRNVYFNQIMNAINNFYLGILIPYFMRKLDKPFKDGVMRGYFQHTIENTQFANLGFVCEEAYLKTWHDMKKVEIVYTLWVIFEDSIDIIYNKISTEEDRSIYQYGSYNKIKNIIENKLTDEELILIKEKLKSQYIGVNNKYNYIFNSLTLDKDGMKNIQEYRNFLHFFNFLRNTLHTNSRSMKDFECNLSIGKFNFEKDKHIDFFTLDTLYSSVNMFVEIFCLIRDKLVFKDKIVNTAKLVENKY